MSRPGDVVNRARLHQRARALAGRYVGARQRLARAYLQGSGLEIGALHMPLPTPAGVSVRYVDRSDLPELRRHYPELAPLALTAPDVIDDGETLASIAGESVDFVIANHMIEHCEDPIGTLENQARVLRPGGILYMAVPDGRRTFDRARPVTALEHVLRDHREGPAWSRTGHYLEWARFVDRADQPEIAAAELEKRDYSIHYHVFTPHSFLAMAIHCRRELGLPLEVETCAANGHEFIVIMRRV